MFGRCRALALVALVVTIAGCSSTKEVSVAEDVTLPDDMREPKGEPIRGYVLTDGTYHEYEGRVRLATPDTLEFWRSPQFWDRNGFKEEPFRIARDQVATIHVRHTSAVTTALVVVGTVAFIAFVAIGAALYTKESCPFVYSYDGERFVFDGEPYGGATMRALERTDWSELEHLRTSGGQYRLLLTNEVDETQHTNSLRLLVVDHAPGTVAIMDKQGTPHAFRRLEPLTGARDETGKDLLRWLREDDLVTWEPNLKHAAGLDSLIDTRNHITLEFARPGGATRGFLVTRVSTHTWGSHMIRTMLGMRGSQVGAFYDAVNTSETAFQQLLAWNAREELFQLFLEVETEKGWVRQDYIPAGGPFISERRAIPLDWADVAGATLRVRIHPPIGFWSLNSFHLAWEEGESRETTLAPEGTGAGAGSEAIASLREDDTRYLDFPNTGDHLELTFRAPRERPGVQRTVFARTRGWYEVHLHDLGMPDVHAIARLSTEPGYAVRRAVDEFEEYRRTGVLLGVPAQPRAPGR